MNVKTVMTVALACGAVALSGCASMKSKDSSAMAPADSNNSNFTVDDTYVARVNHVARENGVTVVWLNPPDKPRHN
jgi:hypothetical protein